MNTRTYTMILALCLLAVVVSGGCSTAPRQERAEFVDSMPSGSVISDPMMARTRADAPVIGMGAPVQPRKGSIAAEPRVDFHGVSGATHSAVSSTGRGSSAALIGLYGEIPSAAADVGSPYDGASNLMQVSFATEGACIDPDIDRTGTFLVFASTMHRATADIYVKSVNGKTLTQLTADPADDVMPCFSPDGSTVAFASRRSGNWDLYTVPATGGRPMQITSDNDPELHPSWSPDGKTIAYCKFGSQSSRWELWTIDVTNPSAPRFLDYGVFPKWNPDPARNKILFQRAKQRGSRDYSIWTVDYVGGQAVQPTEIVSAANAALINPAWSADGARIVFVSVIDPDTEVGATPSQSDLWVVNIDGTNRINLTNGQFANYQPVWAGDGKVYFVSNRSGVDNIWAVSTSTMRTIGAPATDETNIVNAEAQNSPTAGHP